MSCQLSSRGHSGRILYNRELRWWHGVRFSGALVGVCNGKMPFNFHFHFIAHILQCIISFASTRFTEHMCM